MEEGNIPLEELKINSEIYESELSRIESWYTVDRKNYFFNYKAVEGLPTGLYNMVFDQNSGFGLSEIDYKSDDVLYLPNLPHEEIVGDINAFLDSRDKFKEYNLIPKRGIIIHGSPGCGKTSLVYLLIEEIKKKNGIGIYFNEPQLWMEIARMVRKIEKDRPLLCIMEDLDLIIERYGEQEFLNFLDGINQVDNIIYIATTNNINEIPDRIKDRPSRFDRKYRIKTPNAEDRKYYIERKLAKSDIDKINIEKLVKDTKNFTIAQIKELIISVYILDNDYDETLKRLKNVVISDHRSFGFGTSEVT